jgi:hypothetical protein
MTRALARAVFSEQAALQFRRQTASINDPQAWWRQELVYEPALLRVWR